MCEAAAFVRAESAEPLVALMKDVASLRLEGGEVVLTSVLGDVVRLRAVTVEIDLLAHRVVLTPGRAAAARAAP